MKILKKRQKSVLHAEKHVGQGLEVFFRYLSYHDRHRKSKKILKK
uniref:Uncharacterized protein n=1 Tax=Siphoviridae sp. ctiuu37 TaxID=2825628 RepID=A0A8S5V7U1_9CAUD|nr:MAG TPA: hypothetical protein [Siphoviridae sp. ctiuu37]